MTTAFALLFPRVDPVVAIHASHGDAQAAVARLGQAGFHGRMLGLVSERRPSLAAMPGLQDAAHRPLPWRASGSFWGGVWATVLVVGALTLPTSAAMLVATLLTAALILVVQTAVVAQAVAPEAGATATWSAPLPAHASHARDLAAHKLLVVVNGSRSEIALARQILRADDSSTPAAA
jgi:hypothetical protein